MEITSGQPNVTVGGNGMGGGFGGFGGRGPFAAAPLPPVAGFGI